MMRGTDARPNPYRKVSADNPLSTNSLDPEPSFFLRRRQTSKSSVIDDSEQVSPHYGASSSPRDSGASGKSNIEIHPHRAQSSLSLGTKYSPNVSDWNEKLQPETHPPSSDSSSRLAVDPPRPPREGYEWVWFPEGYWAEREAPPSLKKQKDRKWFNKLPDRQSSTPPPIRGQTRNRSSSNVEAADIPRIKIGSRVQSSGGSPQPSSVVEDRSARSSDVDTPGSKIKKGLQYVSPTHPHFTSPSGQPEGLYCKIKRNVETSISKPPSVVSSSPNKMHRDSQQKFANDNDTNSEYRLPSRTTLVLEGTSSYFDQESYPKALFSHAARVIPAASATPASSDSRPRRGFGLAPWHRKTSHESLLSVSSSVHRLLMGRAPVASPAAEKQDDNPLEVRIEISEAGQPNFLPSEATRIKTPPLSGDSSPPDQPQGFFFEMSPMKDEASSLKSSPTGLSTGSNHGRLLKKKKSRHSPDWWEVDNPARKQAAKGLALQKQLESDMHLPPEHLPSSPLCPRNPMHKSQGRGICVYHGRRRSTSLKSSDGVNSPVPEYEDFKGLYEMS